MEKFIICFDNNNGKTFYFNDSKQSFVLSEIADLSDESYYSSLNYCPLWVQEIAISEFKCSLEYAENFGIQVRSLEIIFLHF